MGGTYKKKQRAEKAKVKLKGAKLPKGLNVTKTDFKVRKIIIREQLKEAQFAEGQRQINLKETLSRLKHHSGQFRQEALRTLREAIVAQHVDIRLKLSELIQAVSALCLDPEKDIRRECFKTLSCLLDEITAETIEPFFHVISSYLRCAMTHIQTAIQEDSLLMLDVLLEHVPQLVAAQSDKILQNFLEMISRVRAEGDKAGRTLSVNMGQKQTTVKWRSKVLQRLAKMLHTQAEYKRRTNNDKAASSCQIRTFNVKEPQYYALKRSYNLQQQQQFDIATIFSRSTGSGDTQTGSASAAEDSLRGYVEHLMPLLLEAWLEVRPQSNATQSILSQDAAVTLQTVVEIITQICCLIDLHAKEMNSNEMLLWLQKEYAEVFAYNFIPDSFPYQKSDGAVAESAGKRAKKSSSTSSMPGGGDPYCLQQNINLTYLMCRFHAGHMHQLMSNKFLLLLQYLHKIVTDLKTMHNIEYYMHLDLALRVYLLDNGSALMKLQNTNSTQLRALLSSVIAAFLHNDFPHKDGLAGRILILLCNIVQQPELVAAYGAEHFKTFLQFLPQLLLKPVISENALTSMSHLGKQKNAVFLEALTHVIAQVIDNIQKIQVSGATNAFEGKKLIMNLFFWPDKSHINYEQDELLQRVDQNVTDKRIVSYYKFILTQA